MHEGHRQRMIERLRSDPNGLKDHEILEVLLFYTIPRRNTNPIAHALIEGFGSLDAVMWGTYDQFLAIEGIGPFTANFLVGLTRLYSRLMGLDVYIEEAEPEPEVFNAREFSKHLPERFHEEETECIEFYCIDECGRVAFTKRIQSNEEDRAVVAAELIGDFVAMQHPHGLIAAHNHPGASSLPSSSDDLFTVRLCLLCELHGVRFYDHFIVGKDGLFSYYSSGKLEDMRHTYNIDAILGEEK